jgi:hypothetical protein
MNEHPALGMAGTVMDAAEELRGYLDPDNPAPWELTEDDHRALMPRLERAISAIGDSIRGIAQATGDEYAGQRLTDSYHWLVQASAAAGLAALSGPGDEPDGKPAEEPDTAAEPAALAASSFPQSLTAGLLRDAAPAPQPRATVTLPFPGTPSPGQSR